MGKGPGTVRPDFPKLKAGSDIRGSLGNWKMSVKIWFCCQNKGRFGVSDKPGGLIEGIRGAMIDYWVCMSQFSLLPCLMLTLTSLQPDTYDKGYELIVSLAPSLLTMWADRWTGTNTASLLNVRDVSHRGCQVLLREQGYLGGTRVGVLQEIER